LQGDEKSSTIEREKPDYANIPRFDALNASHVHAVNGNGGGLLFAAAPADSFGICFLGFGCDLGANFWPIFCHLDAAGKSSDSNTTLAKNRRLQRRLAHSVWMGNENR
jgi:hypothetical protein